MPGAPRLSRLAARLQSRVWAHHGSLTSCRRADWTVVRVSRRLHATGVLAGTALRLRREGASATLGRSRLVGCFLCRQLVRFRRPVHRAWSERTLLAAVLADPDPDVVVGKRVAP